MKRCLLSLVRLYQLLVSPLLPGQCRFLPSCSDYAVQALEEHGTLKGTALTLRRLLRCQPLCRPGLDPVPERRRRPVSIRPGARSGKPAADEASAREFSR